jgi:hypothetical protein
MRRFKEIAFTIFIYTLIAYALLIAGWLFYPYKPIVVTSIEVMNPGKVVMAGDWLIYKIKYDKRMNISGMLSRKIINSTKIDLADVAATSPEKKGCDIVYVEIPKRAEAGKYHLWWSADYKVNPIRTITVQAKSDEFYIFDRPSERK